MEVRAATAPVVAGAAATTIATTHDPRCTPFVLLANGILEIDATRTITLSTDAIYQPSCTLGASIITNSVISSEADLRDPFYASTLPQCYALAATTVMSYFLVIMLLITPRTFVSGGTIVLGHRGFTNGHSTQERTIGVGGRPWLQKVAALTVAISLTIATVNYLKVAEWQYEIGYMDATSLQSQVLNGTELKVIRTISDTFLWLAQAQTLIRLFPRHREKVIIKWSAFALILLDSIFDSLNSFVYANNNRPRSFVDAIPALSYLFDLALGLLYCAWVTYYAITKRKYAFYHSQMRNICLVAFISEIALLVPIVFFVLDISKPQVAGWGDYVRWVGAAAASVVVWEWVERIEALERNDKKDGILGREVFDGDEMLEVTPTTDAFPSRRPGKGQGDGGEDGISTGMVGNSWPPLSGIAHRYRSRIPYRQASSAIIQKRDSQADSQDITLRLPSWPARPLPTATPISRNDTASAESTIYTVRYHPVGASGHPVFDRPIPQPPSTEGQIHVATQSTPEPVKSAEDPTSGADHDSKRGGMPSDKHPVWHHIAHWTAFRLKSRDLPPEVSACTKKPDAKSGNDSTSSWDILGRLEDFAAMQADRFRDRGSATRSSAVLPITRIPAPSRGYHRDVVSEPPGQAVVQADAVTESNRVKDNGEDLHVCNATDSTSAEMGDTRPHHIG